METYAPDNAKTERLLKRLAEFKDQEEKVKKLKRFNWAEIDEELDILSK